MAAVFLLLTMMASTATTTTVTPNTASAAPISQSSDGRAIKAAQSLHNRIFIGYVILLAITVLATFLVWWSASKAQEAIQADANARIAAAQQATAKLENDNLILRKEFAAVQKDASDARAAQQRVEIELAKQQERAAIAERALLELQQRLEHRRISPVHHARFVAALRPYAGSTLALIKLGDLEAGTFADDILSVLADAGWRVNLTTIGVMGPPKYGLQCSINDQSQAGKFLASVMRELPTASIESAPHLPVVADIIVGLKPLP